MIAALEDVVDTWYVVRPIVRDHEGEEAGRLDAKEVRGLSVVGTLLGGVEDADDTKAYAFAISGVAVCGALARVVDGLHGGELHWLILRYVYGGEVSRLS